MSGERQDLLALQAIRVGIGVAVFEVIRIKGA